MKDHDASDAKDDEIDAALDAWKTPEPADGLADRVLARVHAPEATPAQVVAGPPATAAPRAARKRPWWPAALAAAVIAVAAAAAHLGRRPPVAPVAATGHHAALARETVAIGQRGLAVAEGGAELTWNVDARGAARVEQPAGRVFYRVAPGGAFLVRTPAGDVEVTGTCFTVEVGTMKVSKQHVAAAGIGAAVSAVVLVTVYEGKVHLANARGRVNVSAGERAAAVDGAEPRKLADGEPSPPLVAGADSGGAAGAAGAAPAGGLDLAGASREQILAAHAAARRELEAARVRIGQLEAEVAEARGPEGDHVDPSPETLAKWAENCEVHLDAPDIFGTVPERTTDKWAAEWGLSEQERTVVDQAHTKLHASALAEMRAIYIDATGNSDGADELTAGAMWSEVADKAIPADKIRARQKLARERAGLAAPPTPAEVAAAPPIERALRLLVRYGQLMEDELAAGMGAKRAHELRRRFNAWPGMQVNSRGCEPR